MFQRIPHTIRSLPVIVLMSLPCRAGSHDLCTHIVTKSEPSVVNYLQGERVKEISIGEPTGPWFVNVAEWSKALKDSMRKSLGRAFVIKEVAAATITVSCDRMTWTQDGELQELLARIRVRVQDVERPFLLPPIRDGQLLTSATAPSLKPVARLVAKILPEVIKHFRGNNINEVELRGISCPAGNHADARRILEAMSRADESVRVVETGAKYWLQGELSLELGKPLPDYPAEHEFAQLRLTLTLKDRRNQTIKEWATSCELDPGRIQNDDDPSNVATLLTVAGITAEPDIAASVRRQHRDVFRQIDEPQAIADDGITRRSASSPYGLAVSVHGARRMPRIVHGDAMVALSRGEPYVLEIVNNSPHEAAIEVTIDGIGHLAFAEPGFSQRGYVIVPAKTTIPIRGWYRNNTSSDSFVVDEYSKSEAARLLSHAAVLGSRPGSITVTFRAAWEKGQPPPPDEPKHGTLGDANATRRGPAVAQAYKFVERQVGVLRACVNVRYSRVAPE